MRRLISSVMMRLYFAVNLTRCYIYIPWAFFTTTIAYGMGDIGWNWRMLPTLIAQFLALVSGFIFNDAEDYKDDARDLAKGKRNVVSSHQLDLSAAYIIAVISAAGSLAVSSLVDVRLFIPIVIILLILFVYSYRRVRLKAIPIIDVTSHGIVGGLLFLAAAWPSLGNSVWSRAGVLTIIAFTIRSAVSQLAHQVKDIDIDRESGFKTTAVLLGKNLGYVVIGCLLVLLVGLMALVVVILDVIPVVLLMYGFVTIGTYLIVSQSIQGRLDIGPDWILWCSLQVGGLAAIVLWFESLNKP